MTLRCDNCRKTRSACAFRCRLCGNLVGATHLRDHLEGHNPNAAGMDFEYIVAQFIPGERNDTVTRRGPRSGD